MHFFMCDNLQCSMFWPSKKAQKFIIEHLHEPTGIVPRKRSEPQTPERTPDKDDDFARAIEGLKKTLMEVRSEL